MLSASATDLNSRQLSGLLSLQRELHCAFVLIQAADFLRGLRNKQSTRFALFVYTERLPTGHHGFTSAHTVMSRRHSTLILSLQAPAWRTDSGNVILKSANPSTASSARNVQTTQSILRTPHDYRTTFGPRGSLCDAADRRRCMNIVLGRRCRVAS